LFEILPKKIKSKNYFITGGLGQDATILKNILKKNKKKFFLITKKSQIIKKNNRLNYIYIDLEKKKEIINLFKKIRPDVVLHLAANNPSFSESSKKKFFTENLKITKNLFNSVFEINQNAKFVFCSSSQIFKKKVGLVNEKSIKHKSTDYTKFRIEADDYMIKYKNKHNIKYTNAILFNHDSIYRNKKFIIPRLINAIIEKKYSFIKTILTKNIYADFSHAEDVCLGIYKLLISKINLDSVIFSSNKLTSLNSIILKLLKKEKIEISKLEYNITKPHKNIFGSHQIARKHLKWNSKKNIHNAASEILEYYKKNFKN